MKYIKITAAIFFVIIITVVPYCLWREHLLAIEIEKQILAGEEVFHEGFELLFLFAYGLYSIIFTIWTAYMFFHVTAENVKRRIFELIAIFILGVLPALGLDVFFS